MEKHYSFIITNNVESMPLFGMYRVKYNLQEIQENATLEPFNHINEINLCTSNSKTLFCKYRLNGIVGKKVNYKKHRKELFNSCLLHFTFECNEFLI